MTYRITCAEGTLQTNAQSINSTDNQYARFRTYMVTDESGAVVYESDPADLDDHHEIAAARADCQYFIDVQS